MANRLALIAYAVRQAETWRLSHLKSTVAGALAIYAANTEEGEEGGKAVAEAFRDALEANGMPKSTRNRHVRNAEKLAGPLAARFAINWECGIAEAVDHIVSGPAHSEPNRKPETLADIGARNVDQLLEFFGLDKQAGRKVEPKPGETLAAALAGVLAAGGGDGSETLDRPQPPAIMERSEAVAVVARGLDPDGRLAVALAMLETLDPDRVAALLDATRNRAAALADIVSSVQPEPAPEPVQPKRRVG